jgi:hypothetical protein
MIGTSPGTHGVCRWTGLTFDLLSLTDDPTSKHNGQVDTAIITLVKLVQTFPLVFSRIHSQSCQYPISGIYCSAKLNCTPHLPLAVSSEEIGAA